MNLIIITGIPCSGKTTISTILSKTMHCDCISKDLFKEQLFSTYGFSSVEEKKHLDTQAEKLLYSTIAAYIEEGKDLIVDKWLQSTQPLQSIRNINNANLIFIRLITDPAIAVRRYNARMKSGKRPVSFMSLVQYPISNETTTCFEQPMVLDEMVEKANREFHKEGMLNLLEIDTSNLEQELDRIMNDVCNYVHKRMK